MFLGTILCLALWSGAYGIGLLVFEPALRALFEIPIWFGINFVGVFFLAFALQYTGRGYRLDSWWMGGIVLIQAIQTAVVITNEFHHVAWSGYRIAPVFGAATVTYVHQPWLFVTITIDILLIATGVFLLLDTVISYGPLYRKQALAVALSPVPPGVAFLIWLFELGPAPALNLAPLTFPLHLALDSYALFSARMFEFSPAARRMGERAAIDDLGSPVAIVDEDRRVITLNASAESLFGVDRADALGRPLADCLGDGTRLPEGAEGTIVIADGGQRREFAITTSSITDPTGSRVGETVLFQDITRERQREQRLEVLNRVLRHNIRNDLNVVQGYLDIARSRIGDEDLARMLRTAEAETKNVIEFGEKSRELERGMAAAEKPRPVELGPVLERLRSDLSEEDPDAEIDLEVPDSLAVLGEERLLEIVFRNLMENAIEHNDAPVPTVSVRVHDRDGETVVVEVRDNGPGIPEYERAAVDAGGEDDLQHGSGLGLWLVEWATSALGGETTFETPADGGTVARVRLPLAGGVDRSTAD